MNTHTTRNAYAIDIAGGCRLGINEAQDDNYRDAQLDDYDGLSRRRFPHHCLSISLRARASSNSIQGTWGFGLWNDPFGMSFGFGGKRFQLPALPNAIWFFSASPQNHLSFQENNPAHGFMTQVFSAPRFHPSIIPAGIAFPFFPQMTRKLLGKIINEDGHSLDIDVTQWHRYRLEWVVNRSTFWVDDVNVFETRISPRPPLGVIIWIDNQFASFTAKGKVAFGVLRGGDEWIEVVDLVIKTPPNTAA
jgi:hypothetical protein